MRWSLPARSLVLGAALAGAALTAPVPVAHARGASLTTATDEQKASASKLYQVAKDAFDAGRYEQALAGFQGSYEVVASPNSHFFMVQALEALGRYGEAYLECEIVLKEANEAVALDPKYTKAAQAAIEKLDSLRPKVGMLTINVTAGANDSLEVNGRPIHREHWGKPLAVNPGPVRLLLKTQAGRVTKEVEIAAGVGANVDIGARTPAPAPTNPFVTPEPQPVAPLPSPTPYPPLPTPAPVTPTPRPERIVTTLTPDAVPEEPTNGLRAAGFVIGGLGVAGLVAFGVLGGLTLAEFNNLESKCPNGSCPPERSGEADTGRGYQTGANAAAIGGAIGLAAGIGMVTASYASDDASPARQTSLVVGPGSVVVRGSF